MVSSSVLVSKVARWGTSWTSTACGQILKFKLEDCMCASVAMQLFLWWQRSLMTSRRKGGIAAVTKLRDNWHSNFRHVQETFRPFVCWRNAFRLAEIVDVEWRSSRLSLEAAVQRHVFGDLMAIALDLGLSAAWTWRCIQNYPCSQLASDV